MKKKIISVIMSIVMLFGVVSFTGCQDNTAGLQAQIDELQEKLDEKMETIEELQGQLENQADIIEQLETTKADLEEEISTLKEENPGVEESAKSERVIEDFKITIEVDKTEVNIGEVITIDVTLENLSEEDIQMVIPDFIAQKGGKEIEDIFEVQMLPDLPDFDVWWHDLVLYHNKPQVTLAKKTSIQKQVQFTVEEKGDFKVHAGAFFYFPENADTLEALQEIIGDAIKIVVRG